MKIETHHISMSASHRFSQIKTSTYEEEIAALRPGLSDIIRIEPQERDLIERLRIVLLQQLLWLFNRKTCHTESFQTIISDLQDTQATTYARPSGLHKEVTFETSIKEEERLDITMRGVVHTNTGCTIPIDLQLGIGRSFYEKNNLTRSVFIDPLIINFNGTLPDLSQETFAFDIDCDGTQDQLSALADGNGFLALDRNKNGMIDDGKELFGTQTGNGFDELSFYDEDNNAWIDENDAIFEGLRIYRQDGEKQTLCTLGEMGIGAIYLRTIGTPFTYKDDSNISLGQLKATGLFLTEKGEVGSIAQIDLATHPTEKPTLKEALTLT